MVSQTKAQSNENACCRKLALMSKIEWNYENLHIFANGFLKSVKIRKGTKKPKFMLSHRGLDKHYKFYENYENSQRYKKTLEINYDLVRS